MENYTKYRLKTTEELIPLLSGTDNLFDIACNKCFKEFDTTQEPDCDAFVKLAQEQGKTVTGTAQLDFLCNKIQTGKALCDSIPEGTENLPLQCRPRFCPILQPAPQTVPVPAPVQCQTP